MRDLAALLGLDPFRAQAMLAAPLFEHRTQADHMQERFLSDKSADRGAVVVVEVAVNRDAALLSEGDRFSDLTPLEIFLAQASQPVGADGAVRAQLARPRGMLRS